jgi:hypothetical protein
MTEIAEVKSRLSTVYVFGRKKQMSGLQRKEINQMTPRPSTMPLTRTTGSLWHDGPKASELQIGRVKKWLRETCGR